MKRFKLIHIETERVLAEGDEADILSLEGNYYIKESSFKEGVITNTYIPGICIYKFFYIWININISDDIVLKNFGWKYILPNPLFYKIFKRIGIPINQNILILEK